MTQVNEVGPIPSYHQMQMTGATGYVAPVVELAAPGMPNGGNRAVDNRHYQGRSRGDTTRFRQTGSTRERRWS